MAGDEGGRLNACTNNIVYKYISHYICNYAFQLPYLLVLGGGWVKASLAGFWSGH